jgi:hypothetical protein
LEKQQNHEISRGQNNNNWSIFGGFSCFSQPPEKLSQQKSRGINFRQCLMLPGNLGGKVSVLSEICRSECGIFHENP